ncbi:hypothetical protein IEQ34_005237 [Dendrobium chrysotoxum]|uniref:Uncharacterized protein n=1 Tax=Dendrobium chrysotoxum TaxID=161865 RepID=A0AAV7GUH2_DENCH|nr:hypothetical protein IEQ34_005237 [Dendrobium chrysotoxum]
MVCERKEKVSLSVREKECEGITRLLQASYMVAPPLALMHLRKGIHTFITLSSGIAFDLLNLLTKIFIPDEEASRSLDFKGDNLVALNTDGYGNLLSFVRIICGFYRLKNMRVPLTIFLFEGEAKKEKCYGFFRGLKDELRPNSASEDS